jgi:hypothetical protein
MSNAFSTTGFAGTPAIVETSSVPYATVRDWYRGHIDELKLRVTGGDKPSDPLETCWESGGSTVCTTTHKTGGETDDQFVARHCAEIAVDALNNPPTFP